MATVSGIEEMTADAVMREPGHTERGELASQVIAAQRLHPPSRVRRAADVPGRARCAQRRRDGCDLRHPTGSRICWATRLLDVSARTRVRRRRARLRW